MVDELAIHYNNTTGKKHLIINSIDRNWNVSTTSSTENPYKYRVVFGNNSFYGTNNKNLNILINDTLEKVNSIQCKKIIIPNRELSSGFRASNQPYLLVNIDNIEQIAEASNNKIQNALSIMTPLIPVSDIDINTRYLEYKNTNGQKKKYGGGRIPYMDIRIQRSDGIEINGDGTQNDILNIRQLVYDDSVKKINVNCTDFFLDDDFKVGDIIKIRDYDFRESSLNYYETAEFNSFINREEGHIIQEIAKSGATEMYDIIKILPDGKNSKTTGNYELETWFDDLVTKTNIDSDLADDDSGKLINTNLQTTIFLEIN